MGGAAVPHDPDPNDPSLDPVVRLTVELPPGSNLPISIANDFIDAGKNDLRLVHETLTYDYTVPAPREPPV